MSLDPHMAVLLVSTTAAGLMMSIAGLRKNGLEWRQRRRICPSCGRQLRGSACACVK
jgi:NADH pyrophosphatase NudC (nudix superfamily)